MGKGVELGGPKILFSRRMCRVSAQGIAPLLLSPGHRFPALKRYRRLDSKTLAEKRTVLYLIAPRKHVGQLVELPSFWVLRLVQPVLPP